MTDDLNFVLKARRDKLQALIDRGVEPFAYSFDRTHDAATAVACLADLTEGPTVRVAGRIVAWRGHGRTAFAHLADMDQHLSIDDGSGQTFKEDVQTLNCWHSGTL